MLIYNNTYGTKCPPSLAALGPPPPGEALSARAAGLTDAETASGVKRTYEIQFSCNPSPFAFTITADPLDNSVYKDHFFVDQTLVIRRQNGAPATVFSLPVNLRYWASSPAGWMHRLESELSEYKYAYDDYPATLAELGPPPKGQEPNASAANLIDAELASGQKLGYRFHYQKTAIGGFEIHADPDHKPILSFFFEKPHYWIGNERYLRREAHSPATEASPITLEQ
jgi:hypothetical protein